MDALQPLKNMPLHDLVITTPHLILRLPTQPELDELAELSRDGVFMGDRTPFYNDWTNAAPDEVARRVVLHHWRKLSSWSPTEWTLPLTVFEAGTVVGTQTLKATNLGITREVRTGSWLGVAHQHRGIGTEMRAAVLTFAFHHLGAIAARSGAFADNRASAGVSAKLGWV